MGRTRSKRSSKKNEGFSQKRKENEGIVDWTKLESDLVLELFTRLNNLDRGSLSSTCKTWKNLGSSTSLWESLDVRAYEFNVTTAQSLSSRARDLSRLTFNDAQSPEPIMSLGARNLKEIIGYRCENITNSTLSVIVAGHPLLQTLQLGPGLSRNISSEGIRTIANSCPNLRKLKLSGISDINEVAINALAFNCNNLIEIGFTDCQNVNETALGNILGLRFLSVAGTQNINWALVSSSWSNLPNLVGLDISRTNVDEGCVYKLLSSPSSLRVLCALGCPQVPAPTAFDKLKIGAKKLLRDGYYDDMYKWICALVNGQEREENKGFLVGGDKETDTMMMWLECVFSHFFLRHYKRNPEVTSVFWYYPPAIVLFGLIKSKQEEVVEIVMKTLSSLKIHGEGTNTGNWLAFWYEEIGLLLHYCKFHKEGLQLQAIKAIATLLADVNFSKSIVTQGGIAILADLTKSMSSLVTKEAARGFCHVAFRADYQKNVIDAGGVKALIEVLSKWSHNEEILVYTANALANFARKERYTMEILRIGGVEVILELAHNCPFLKVAELALHAVVNLSSHGDRYHDNAGIGKMPGVIGSFVEYAQSYPHGIRLKAVDALLELCRYEGYSKTIIAAGVIEAFVALAEPDNSPVLQEKAANFLWFFSFTKENSIAIGERNGIAALIELSRSDIADVRENASRGLCSLALVPCNATRIKSAGGVPLLIEFYNSIQSRQAKLCSTLALACLYEERNGDFSIKDHVFWEKSMALDHIGDYILTVCDPTIFSFVAASPIPSILEKQAKALFIRDEEILECSDWMIEKLISLLRDSSDYIKACAAFTLIQVIASDNNDWMIHTKYVQEAGGLKILRVIAASKAAPDSVRVLSKILLLCLEKNQKQMELDSSSNIGSEK